jgi:hypothetical protein
MNIFYTEEGDIQTNVRATSVGEAAQLLGVLESKVEDAGEVPMIPARFDDSDDIDTQTYEEWEKSVLQNLTELSNR